MIGIYASYNISGVNQKALRLRLYPFSLTDEATLWLGEVHQGSITTCNELKN